MRPALGNCVFQSASLGRKFKIGVSCHTNVGQDQRSPLEAQEVKLYFYPLALIFGGLLHFLKKKVNCSVQPTGVSPQVWAQRPAAGQAA